MNLTSFASTKNTRSWQRYQSWSGCASIEHSWQQGHTRAWPTSARSAMICVFCRHAKHDARKPAAPQGVRFFAGTGGRGPAGPPPEVGSGFDGCLSLSLAYRRERCLQFKRRIFVTLTRHAPNILTLPVAKLGNVISLRKSPSS